MYNNCLHVNVTVYFPSAICCVLCQSKQFCVQCYILATPLRQVLMFYYLLCTKPQLKWLKQIFPLRLRTSSRAFWLQRRWLTRRRRKSWRITWWRLRYWHLVTMTTSSSFWTRSIMTANSGWARYVILLYILFNLD